MPGPEASNLLDVLVRRGPLLRRIGEGTRRKSTLVEDGDVSRSTIDRGVRELECTGLLERSDERYRLTVAGRMALDAYEAFLEQVEGLAEGSPALRDLPPDAPLHRAVVREPDVAVATHPDPDRPTRVQRDLLRRATHQRILVPKIFPQHVDMYHDAIARDDLSARFVVTTDVLEFVLSNHPERLQDALEHDEVSLREAESLPPYGLTVSETAEGPVLGLLVFTESGVSAFLSTDDERAIEWARDLFERHWDRARPIDR